VVWQTIPQLLIGGQLITGLGKNAGVKVIVIIREIVEIIMC
jgi:glutaredoxin-related protein